MKHQKISVEIFESKTFDILPWSKELRTYFVDGSFAIRSIFAEKTKANKQKNCKNQLTNQIEEKADY